MTRDNESVVRLRYSVAQIIAQKNSLGLDLYHRFANKKLVGETYNQFVHFVFAAVSLALRQPLLQYDVVNESLRMLAGKILTQNECVDLMHRLLGNKWTLKENKPVKAYSQIEGKEWVPVQIMQMVSKPHPKKGEGYEVTLKVLAGFPTTETTKTWWSLPYCRFVSWKMFGMKKKYPTDNRKREVFLYKSPLDMVTLRLSGLIDYDKSEKCLVFVEFVATSSLMHWNKEQMRFRARRAPKYACPRNYPITLACSSCPVGYLECRAGCHPTTYAVKMCPTCEQQAYFDDERSQNMCVNCFTARNATT